ncbi:Flp1 family type IVb pilin [Acetivibrio ethanolgignens]|uniref:Holin, BlyA family protein n=1 Tax=Acetivibrio ethanolgignens TaxID=290052 RepID=A0A0V8QFN2_9FIRM|nr:Flp1 family type IVb pilin [Acetivibrio ethanolgignens]KSV59230.1 holin, BlyA family protein [Acetivibrio ethanolgignens]
MGEVQAFWKEEDGVGVVEIILILVILIGLVLMFKEEIGKIIDKAFKSIRDDSGKILK